jgi:phosphoglycolate phosphatase-like HAD superfamily hydrolase
MSRLKYGLIAFDCDGTLTDSARQVAILCNDLNVTGRYSLPLINTRDPSAVKNILGATMEIVFEKYGFPQEEIPHLINTCKRTFLQDTRYVSSPFPGVSLLLEKLRKEQVPLGLVTANLIENVTRDLGRNIEHFTEVIDKHQLTEKN